MIKIYSIRVGRDSGDKSSDCSFRGPKFDSQHPHGDSELPVTPVSGHPVSFPTSSGTRHIFGAQTDTGKTLGYRVVMAQPFNLST